MKSFKLFLLFFAAFALAQAQGVNTTIACGQLIDGTIIPSSTSVGVVLDFYNFTAQAGDAIAVRLTWTNTNPSADPNAKLTIVAADSSNRVVMSRRSLLPTSNTTPPPPDALANGTNFEAIYDLPVEGRNQIKIQNFSAVPMTYRLTFIYLNRSCSSNSLVCGVSQPGQITEPLQVNSYQFAAKAGDQLAIRLGRLAPQGKNADATVVVYSAAAQFLGLSETGQTGVAGGTIKAVSDGLITLLVFDLNNSTESYVITASRLNGGCNSKALSCGGIVSGNIATPLGSESFSLSNIAPGDVISIRTAPVSQSSPFVPVVEVYDSQGVLVTNGLKIALLPTLAQRQIRNLTFTAPSAGSYTVLVENATTQPSGNYTMAMVRLNRPCPGAQTLSCGQSVDDSLQGLLAAKSYQFTGLANDKFMLRLLRTDPGGALIPHVDVYDLSGNNIKTANVTNLSPETFSLPADGAYTLILTDGYDNSQAGTYSLSLRRLNGPCNANSPALTCGVAAAGSFSQALDSPEYTFTAAPGQLFSVRLIDQTGALQPSLTVYDSQGNVVGQPISGSFTGVDVTKAAGGLYTILALDSSRRPAGGAIGIDVLSPSCTLPAAQGQTISSAITAPRPFGSYTLQAGTGDVLSIRAVSFNPGFTPQMDLYDPNGQRIDTAAGQLSRKVTAGGTYTVIVGASTARTGGAYALVWQLLNSPAGASPLTCGGATASSLTASNQFRYYTANASAGDLMRLIFTRLSDNFAPQVELFDPSGTRIAQTSDISQKAAADGDYLLVVSPSTSNGENGTYNLAYQRPNRPCSPVALTCGQTALRAVTQPAQLDTFTFTGTGAHQANVRLAQRTGSYSPFVELYDTSGTRMATTSSGLLRSLLPAGGTYTLLVRDLNAVNTGSYRVTLQDDTSACTVNDTESPAISLTQPTGGEVIAGGLAYHIQWQSDDNVGVAAHDVALSIDGGQTFSAPIAAGLSGNAQAFDWTVPPDIAPSRKAVIRVTATDAAGNAQTTASGLLSIIGAGFQPNSTGTFTYDSLNRLTQAALSGGRTVQYTWDAAGNLTEIRVSGQ